MSVLPFALSTEATAWMEKNLKKGVEDPGTEMGVRSLIRCLEFIYGYAMWEEDYAKLLERYDQVCFEIGWYRAEGMDPGGYHQIEIGGFKVFVHHSTLKLLEGMELILEEVEDGYPIPSSKKRQLLRARPKGGEDSKVEAKSSPIS